MNLSKTPIDTFKSNIPQVAFMCMLALIAVLCLAGCGGTAAANTSNTQSPPARSQDNSTSGDSVPGMAMSDETAPGADNATREAATAQPSSAQQSDNSGTDSGNETVVQAALVEWSIQLSSSEVPAGKIRFVVTNRGTMPHNLTVEDGSGIIAKTPNFRPAQGPQTLEVDLKPGTYTLVCTLPGHAKKGQVATFVVK